MFGTLTLKKCIKCYMHITFYTFFIQTDIHLYDRKNGGIKRTADFWKGEKKLCGQMGVMRVEKVEIRRKMPTANRL